MKELALMMALLLQSAGVQSQVNYQIDLGSRPSDVSPTLYGIFYEEINHAGDGGLYAELIRNRSFEDDTSTPVNWSAENSATMSLVTTDLLNDAQEQALSVTFAGSDSRIVNEGFWGMKIEEGKTYKLSFWTKAPDTYTGTLRASLRDSDGTECGYVTIAGPFSNTWTKYTAEIVPTTSADGGNFSLQGSEEGTLLLDMVSLFPPTFKGHENGLRIDLAEKLEAMHPAFIRFPGGCYVEGEYTEADGKTNRFEWKKTIGPIEERAGHLNKNWGYRVSDGMGFHEFLQLCEDLNAEALFVVNIGLGHYWYENYQNIDEYVQEALDALEYANGDVSTTYGAMRAANGHPDPFNLTLIEVGNENYNYYSDNNNDQSDHYAERYYQFYQAIHTAYPDVKIIGNVQAWSTDTPSWRNAYPVDLVDEHYYRTPAWFLANYHKYDSYSRSNYKIYPGEYAVTEDYGTYGNLNAAIGEAVFMQGMENNADLVRMSSYAPIFVNENDQKWKPDMIRFNSSMSYATPSYYVQKLFASNVGDETLAWTETNNNLSAIQGGRFGLGSWNTAVSYADISVTDANDATLINGGGAASDWTAGTGTWTLNNGTVTQSNTSTAGATYINNTTTYADTYTYTLKATKTGGSEGFLIIFDYVDANNYTWWNLGGWGNTQHAVEQCVNGTKTTMASAAGSLTTNQEYTVQIVRNGTDVKCYLDGTLVHEFTYTSSDAQALYASSTISNSNNVAFIKLVNPNDVEVPAVISFSNGTALSATAEVLTSTAGTDENTTTDPENVVPQTVSVTVGADGTVAYNVPAFSVNILKVSVTDVILDVQELATVPDAVVSYSFEAEQPMDDNGLYQGSLHGDASIITMTDGNHVLYSGAIGGQGYMDLTAQMGQATLAALGSSFSVSMNVLVQNPNNLASFAWALALANGTTSYLGLINGAGNQDWYVELKNSGTTQAVASGTGLSTMAWHNLTYTQDDTQATLYIDGRQVKTATVSITPDALASAITAAYIGRSPFTGDAYMENTCFDDLTFYDVALSQQQVATLYENAKTLATAESTVSAIQGDVNGDGVVDIGDVINLIEYLVKECEIVTANSDLDDDGAIVVDDVIILINWIISGGSNDSGDDTDPYDPESSQTVIYEGDADEGPGVADVKTR